jgi:hypothetical protein
MNTSKPISVWDGVKIGFGIFIVLPAIVVSFLILLVCIPTCAALKKHKAQVKQRMEQKGGIQ